MKRLALLPLLFTLASIGQAPPKPVIGWKLVMDKSFVTNTLEQPRTILLSDATYKKRVKYAPTKAGMTQVKLEIESEFAGVTFAIVRFDRDAQQVSDVFCSEKKVLKSDPVCWLPPSDPALIVQDSRAAGTALAGLLGMFVSVRGGGGSNMAEQMAAPNKVHIKLYELDCIENCPAWVNEGTVSTSR